LTQLKNSEDNLKIKNLTKSNAQVKNGNYTIDVKDKASKEHIRDLIKDVGGANQIEKEGRQKIEDELKNKMKKIGDNTSD